MMKLVDFWPCFALN